MKLFEVGEIALGTLQSYIHDSEKDVGWEIYVNSDNLQTTMNLNFFDAMGLTIKLYQHKNSSRETVFRFEVFITAVGEMRGTRIASVEIQQEKITLQDIQSFLEGVLARTGVVRGGRPGPERGD